MIHLTYRFVLISLLILSINLSSGCVSKPSPPKLERFTCLSGPSGVYQPGTVLRTVVGNESSEKLDDLTVAYKPISPVDLSGKYGDITQTILSSVDASFTTSTFKKLGSNASATANAKYDIIAEAKDNTHYIATDGILSETLNNHGKGKRIIIKGVDYYFIKEALGSKTVNYSAKANAGADLSVKLLADTSPATVKIKALDSKNSLNSSEELIICIVAEKLEGITVTRGANGVSELSYERTVPLSTHDFRQIETAAEALNRK